MLLVFDMYGVIIEESRGNFGPYVYAQKPETDWAFFRATHTRATLGEIDFRAFCDLLGLDPAVDHTREYVTKHLTLDPAFPAFAEKWAKRIPFALLSNDVAEWNRILMEKHGLSAYIPEERRVVSAEVRLRKPDPAIFRLALDRFGVPAQDCLFIDNASRNVRAAEACGLRGLLFNRDHEDYPGESVDDFAGLDAYLTSVLS